MPSGGWLHVALAFTRVADTGAHGQAREMGRFGPSWDGGSDYYYADPDISRLPPLAFRNHQNMTCSANRHASPFARQIRGVNLGGWLVIEPWITPSLFYQFLGADTRWGDLAAKKVGMDLYTFCEALGAAEANRQLRRHWQSWVTEEDVRRLAALNLDTLRIPVGDWMWRPYGPYANCTAGALAELDRALALAERHGLRVLLDLHGLEGSQNGLDNSGRAAEVRWTRNLFSDAPEMRGRTFAHWPSRKAEWIGRFDPDSLTYSEIYWDRIDASLDVVRRIADMYAAHPAVLGLQPANEPWQFTPIGPLKRYYWEGFKIVKRRAPGWTWLMHDSFRLRSGLWDGFMRGCPDVAMDTHVYTAWDWPGPADEFYRAACAAKRALAAYEARVMPVVVGEWSLATDNCAMWINGFQDNIPGYPMVQCDFAPCGGDGLDASQARRGPFGTGDSSPSYGLCPVDRAWRSPSDREVTTRLGFKKLSAFAAGHGWFYWNFKTELEPKWDYLRAVEAGWLPRDAQAATDDIRLACEAEDREDQGEDDALELECRVKPTASRAEVLAGVSWACQSDSATPARVPACRSARDDASRLESASAIFAALFTAARAEGVACDFGGAAELFDPAAVGRAEPELRRLLPPEFGAVVAAGSTTRRAEGAPRLTLAARPAVALAAVGAFVALALGGRRALRTARDSPPRPPPLDDAALDARLLDQLVVL